MRIKSTDDLSRLGTNAKKQIEAALKEMGGIKNQKLADSANEYACVQKTEPVKPKSTEQTPDTGKRQKTKSKPSRVMRTESGATYCPWPSTDPFVSVIQRLEKKYGRYDDGGLVLTELIIDGGEKDWRFDIALLSPFKTVNISGSSMYIGKTCLIHVNPQLLLKVLHPIKTSARNVVTLFTVLHAKIMAKYAKVLQENWACA